MSKLIVRVPATSTNLGAGFDSVGLALKMYYTVIVEEKTKAWKVNHALGKDIPVDENNLIVQSILKTDSNIEPHQLTVISDVPIARGLGASTTAVVAGIKIANALGNLNLTAEEQIDLGTQIEGHPENVAAAVLGGLTVATTIDNKTFASRIEVPDLAALMYIKPDDLSSEQKRLNLPKNINFNAAIDSSSKINTFIALMANQKWQQALPLVENDHFYEPSQKEFIPEIDVIRSRAHSLNIYGTYLSGTSLTVTVLNERTKLTNLRIKLQEDDLKGSLRIVDVDHDGATVRGE